MADTVYIGTPEFAADLQAFSDAIGTVSADRDAVSSDIQQIKAQFATVETFWAGPAEQSFAAFTDTLNTSTQTLLDLLDELVSRMSATYQNYQNAESDNTNNLS
jgi:uncharacterized protein YukE